MAAPLLKGYVLVLWSSCWSGEEQRKSQLNKTQPESSELSERERETTLKTVWILNEKKKTSRETSLATTSSRVPLNTDILQPREVEL